MDGNAIQDIFKVYMVDSGLLIAMLEDGTQFDVLQGNLYGYKGAILKTSPPISWQRWAGSSIIFIRIPAWKSTS